MQIEDKVRDGVEDGTTLVEKNRKMESGGCKAGKKKVKEKMSGLVLDSTYIFFVRG